jgi:3-hydroxyacyl-CoA dehydrogenase
VTLAGAQTPVTSHFRDGVCTLTIDNPPVNALSEPVRTGLWSHLEEAADDDRVAAVIIIGARSFVAGADIREFGKPVKFPSVRELLGRVDQMNKPVIAAIDGVALGGGFELALACHYRVVTPRAVVGLPEIGLGLLPGAGGTQRLPRVLGPNVALDLLLEGRQIPAPRALELGLVDHVVEDLATAARRVVRGIDAAAPLPRTSDHRAGSRPWPIELFDSVRALNAEKWRGQLAPWKIVDCVEAAGRLAFADGIAFEREAFLACAASPQHRALTYLFQATRALRKAEDLNLGAIRDRLFAALRDEAAELVEEGYAPADINRVTLEFGISQNILDTMLEGLPRGVGRRLPADIVVVDRLIDALIREADALVERREIQRTSDADVIAVQRLGFPAHRGGPAYFASRTQTTG